jgi:hypothetical protein
MMQAFIYRHLVCADDLKVAVIGRAKPRAPAKKRNPKNVKPSATKKRKPNTNKSAPAKKSSPNTAKSAPKKQTEPK